MVKQAARASPDWPVHQNEELSHACSWTRTPLALLPLHFPDTRFHIGHKTETRFQKDNEGRTAILGRKLKCKFETFSG